MRFAIRYQTYLGFDRCESFVRLFHSQQVLGEYELIDIVVEAQRLYPQTIGLAPRLRCARKAYAAPGE
jgi:hypothetical protein